MKLQFGKYFVKLIRTLTSMWLNRINLHTTTKLRRDDSSMEKQELNLQLIVKIS